MDAPWPCCSVHKLNTSRMMRVTALVVPPYVSKENGTKVELGGGPAPDSVLVARMCFASLFFLRVSASYAAVRGMEEYARASPGAPRVRLALQGWVMTKSMMRSRPCLG